MRKKILLSLTIIISMIVGVNSVMAATELTCVYKKGVAVFGQPAVKIVQYADGTKKVYINKKEKEPDVDSESWLPASRSKVTEDLSSCPKYINYKDGTVIFNKEKKSGYTELIKESNTIPEVDKKYSNIHDIPDIKNTTWLKECTYRKVGGDDYIFLFFNNDKMKLFHGISDVTETVGNHAIGMTSNDIKLDDLLKTYNKSNSCPNAVYINSKISSGFTAATITTYSLKNDNGATFLLNRTQNGASTSEDPVDDDSCDLFDKDLIDFINKIMQWIRIFVPILLIGLGILDFTKAVFSKNEDDMKKSREKFIKRIIAAVAVFLVPMFVNFILDLANSVWSWINPNTCIK